MSHQQVTVCFWLVNVIKRLFCFKIQPVQTIQTMLQSADVNKEERICDSKQGKKSECSRSIYFVSYSLIL